MDFSLKHLGSIVFGSAIAQKLLEAFATKGVEVATGKLEKSFEENRSETLALIISEVRSADKKASDRLLARHRKRQRLEKRSYQPYEPYQHGDESKMAHGLSELYAHLQKEEEKELRVEVFCFLGNLGEKKFDETLEWLVDDRVQQWLGKTFTIIRGAYGHSEKAVRDLFHRMLDALTGAEHLETVTDKLAVIFSEAVQVSDIVGATAFKGMNKFLLGAESLLDKIPGGKK